ncbi:major facilitator superfamily domain-containing protein [Alternaria rosae]|uniref:major facilitator superfamily domain-containing protein n=1 Tax=Alternaria rosae TaxID=1187941 RepID=UPI001E8E88BB|nr:major facilitator superfamily domain-containing protein [Alternaria rosae]KAH6879246.1 major facilitator superfamily domain-containing protein [Alternaria rosae]
MLGFHRRTRSLIPVKDLGKYDKVAMVEEEEERDVEEEMESHSAPDGADKSRRMQLMLVYLIFLAEAIMASSLQPQLQMLLSSSDYCGTLSSSYLRSILDCAYAFGGTTGLFWGYLADRMGRRRVTLIGLWSMFACCLSMGFATSLVSCTIFRFFAGMVSSAIVCTTLTMIGDLSTSAEERAKNVARLPTISLGGSMGPIMQLMVSESLQAYNMVWQDYPTLGSELACGAVLFGIALTASICLKETLPHHNDRSADPIDMDCEKAAFLRRDSEDTNVTLVDFARPDPITISQFLQAPSLMVLLSSFCLLSLHASTFDVVLPHLGHSSTDQGGMGISCEWLSIVVLCVRGMAGMVLFYAIPYATEKYGLVKLYRSVSAMLPATYVLTPILAIVVTCSGLEPVISTFSIFAQHLLTGGANVVVSLLVLNTTPDAFSAGTVVGMMQIASLFKAFAVAVSGTSYYFSDDLSVQTTNFALWTCLALFGIVGAGLAWFVRERPSVEKDFPSEVLCWETCFDADAEKQFSLEDVQEV